MGKAYSAICSKCGHEFRFDDGPSMLAAQLRCDRCGKDKWIKLDEMPVGLCSYNYDPADDPDSKIRKCHCGGTFSSTAPPRCPKCRSEDIKYDPENPVLYYD